MISTHKAFHHCHLPHIRITNKFDSGGRHQKFAVDRSLIFCKSCAIVLCTFEDKVRTSNIRQFLVVSV